MGLGAVGGRGEGEPGRPYLVPHGPQEVTHRAPLVSAELPQVWGERETWSEVGSSRGEGLPQPPMVPAPSLCPGGARRAPQPAANQGTALLCPPKEGLARLPLPAFQLLGKGHQTWDPHSLPNSA